LIKIFQAFSPSQSYYRVFIDCFQDILQRFVDGKVAELSLSIVYNGTMLEMTVQKIDKIHGSINKKTAYVR